MVSNNSDGYKRLILASDDYSLEPAYPGAETYIYTNNCYMNSDVQAKTIHLHTSSFALLSDGSKFDISGQPGQDNVSQSDDHADGKPGTDFYFSSANFDADNAFHIFAQGGDGGSGYYSNSKQGGKGGNGGDGGKISLTYDDTFRVGYMACENYYFETDNTKKAAYLAEWVTFLQLTITRPQPLVTKINDFASSYSTMSSSDTVDAVKKLLKSLDSASATLSATLSSQMSYHGGAYGTGGSGNPSGSNGVSGQMGSDALTRTLLEGDIRNSNEILFHPDQVAMTLNDISNDYFLGSSDSLLSCGRSLRVLIHRLSFLPQLTTDDQIYQSYASNETNLFILPSGSSTPTSVTSLNNSLAQASAYMSQLGKGLDIYSHIPTWVPRGSYSYYNQQLTDVLANISDIESNYETYKDAASDQTKKRGAIKISLQQAQAIIKRANSDITRLKNGQGVAAKIIESFSPLLPDKRKSLIAKVDQLSTEIKNHFSVSISDFLDAAAQFAFQPGFMMATVQAGRLIFDAKTTIPDGSNVNVNKDYLINQVQFITADMDGLTEGLKMGAGSPTLTIDDPGAAKLLLEEQKLTALISQYGDLLKDYASIKSEFDEYIKMVLARNNTIFHYNAIVILWLQAENLIATQQQQVDLLQAAQVDQIDPDLPMIAAFVKQSYFHTVAQILRLLYLTERALVFWTLADPQTNLSTLRQSGFERTGLAQSLKSAKVDILAAYSDAIENSTSLSQQFGPSSPICVYLIDTQLDSLEKKNFVNVTICEAYSFTTKDDNPFADCADVRLTKVRFYAKGACTSDNMLTVSLKHTGHESIVDTDDYTHSFSHNDINLKFQYNTSTGDIQTDGDMTGIVNGEYALPGPFTIWIVEINDLYNTSLDLSGVTSAWFEFSGWSRAF